MENSHASTSLSYADGMAKAYKLRGEHDRTVVAVIGDGALTGGMAWEALNNIAVARDSRLVIVVNDNGRSYQPTIGGLASHLSSIRVSQRYEHVLDLIKTTVTAAPIVGNPLFGALHGAKKGLKDFLQPQVLFEDLGIKYIGPIDGHDEQMTENALRQANEYGGPVLVHVITRKGFGYALAEQNEEDCLHQVPGTPAKPARRRASRRPPRPRQALVDRRLRGRDGRHRRPPPRRGRPSPPRCCTRWASPRSRQAYPDRVYDAGIAEQHAMTMAAGLAMAGLHPVVSVYATFLNRAFDQLLMDVALHRLPVTVTLDRAGVTGPDGASHNGMWDGSILQVVPGLRVAAPRDGSRIAELLNEAVGVSDGPTVVRYPKGDVGAEAEAVGKLGQMDILAVPAGELSRDVLLLGAGPMAVTCVEVASRLAGHGIGVTVVDPRWVKPVDEAVVAAARQHRLVAVVEDNGRAGGFGDAVARLLRDHDVDVPVKTFGLAQEFLTHGTRKEILEAAGLTPQHLARQLTEAVARRTPEATPAQAGAARGGATADAPEQDSSTQGRLSE